MQVSIQPRIGSVSAALSGLALVFLVTAHALAGANAGGWLFLYTNDTINYTSDTTDYAGLSGVQCDADPIGDCPPYDGSGCASRVDQARRGYVSYRTDTTIVFWVMAVWGADACPRMKGVQFGIDYDPDRVTIVAHGTDASFELTTPRGGHDWPAPNSGTALTWDQPQTSPCKEVYWFAAEVGSSPSEIWIARHPAGNAWPSFGDDAVPSNLDHVEADCLMGLGVAGSLAGDCRISTGHEDGACCLPDGTCQYVSWNSCVASGGIFDDSYHECVVSFCSSVAIGACCLTNVDQCILQSSIDCRAQQGAYAGDWTSCDPLRCTTAIERTTWGGIKQRYR